MSLSRLSIPPELAEWQRSGRYLAIAAALHAVVLYFPGPAASGRITPPPVDSLSVRLSDPAAATPARPPESPPQPPVATPNPAPQRERPTPAARPVIARQATPESAPASFSVPAAAASEPAVPAAAASTVSAPAAVLTAARFDAAYLQNPAPKYPQVSRRMGEEGKVLLRVKVAPDGSATSVELEQSSNFERLDEAARQVVARWRFVPARRGDQPVEAAVIVPIVFRLDS